MPPNTDRQQFRNQELMLHVSLAVDRSRWDESRYEAFLDALCGYREYQKESIREALRYLLSGQYADLRALAQENYRQNPILESRYGSWKGMERHLQFPHHLAATLDLATGVGKSYVLYGLAAIMLAEGAVDRVLVLCPSTTIELGLLDKFRALAGDADLRTLLPANVKWPAPHILNASESITEGSICIENYHAVLEHVGSSIRDSLSGKGARTLVLNDEAHHVVNESQAQVKKWKEFLLDPAFGFRYILGVSGTCYVKDEYFADVIYRYSLRQAMEERYVKKVSYVAEVPPSGVADAKWQLIYNYHADLRRKLKPRGLLPLTIIVTQTIRQCQDVTDELKGFLHEYAEIAYDEADAQVLTVYNNAEDVKKLPYVDFPTSRVEWIVAVSMLNEGWDVKRVFQIVPHEQRAFNSKLLIAQVLGRGLRIPDSWQGPQPEVVVFNHENWAPGIRHLVNEVLEIERRLTSAVREDSPYHFDLHTIDYTLEPTTEEKLMTGPYTLLEKGYVDLASQEPTEYISVVFEHADTKQAFHWGTELRHKTHTPQEIALVMYERLQEADNGNAQDPDPALRTHYTAEFPVARLEAIVLRSLAERGAAVVTETMRQRFLQALGTLRRKATKVVRYTPVIKHHITFSTRDRQADSVNAAALHGGAHTYFHTPATRDTLVDEQIEFFDEVIEPGSTYSHILVENLYDFKTPLNAVIADSSNERKFLQMLLDHEHLFHYDAWIKSTNVGFYAIDYSWKKGEHPKRGKFSPDFFVKAGNAIIVVEIKDDDELRNPSEENRKKNEYALAHFARVNTYLKKGDIPLCYYFHFLTPCSYTTFFTHLREGQIDRFRSELDLVLVETFSDNGVS